MGGNPTLHTHWEVMSNSCTHPFLFFSIALYSCMLSHARVLNFRANSFLKQNLWIMGSSPHNLFLFLFFNFWHLTWLLLFTFLILMSWKSKFLFLSPTPNVIYKLQKEIVGFFFLTFFFSRRHFWKSVYFHLKLVLDCASWNGWYVI